MEEFVSSIFYIFDSNEFITPHFLSINTNIILAALAQLTFITFMVLQTITSIRKKDTNYEPIPLRTKNIRKPNELHLQ